MTIKIILKNGTIIPIKCENLKTTTSNITGELLSYELDGITENNPVYMNLKDVSAIIRVLSDEKAGAPDV